MKKYLFYKFCCVNFHISNNIKIHINKLFLHESVYKVLLNHTIYTQFLTKLSATSVIMPGSPLWSPGQEQASVKSSITYSPSIKSMKLSRHKIQSSAFIISCSSPQAPLHFLHSSLLLNVFLLSSLHPLLKVYNSTRIAGRIGTGGMGCSIIKCKRNHDLFFVSPV